MQPLKTIVRPRASSRIGCAPRSLRSMIASRRWTIPTRPSTHTPEPSGPRGCIEAPIRSSASRSTGPSRRTSMPKPHTVRPRDRAGRTRPRRPAPRTAAGAARGGPASPRATARPARADRRRPRSPRSPRSSRPAPTRRPAGPSPSRSTAWWWNELTHSSVGAEDRASREPGSTCTACVSSQPGSVWRWSTDVVGDRRQVLVQRAAAGDVERLRAAADAEDRQPSGVGTAGDLELEDVQPRLDRPEIGRRRGAVGARVQVRAAGQADAPQRRQQRGDGLDRQRRQHDRDRPGSRERAHVRHAERHLVLRRLALGQRLRPLGPADLGSGHTDERPVRV